MSEQHDNAPAGRDSFTRREALRGMAAVGTGAVGAQAATQNAEAGNIDGGCLDDLPEAMDRRVDLAGDTPEETDTFPTSGELVMYVHGIFSEDILDEVDINNGAQQAATLSEAFDERDISREIVAGMWDSTTSWTPAKWNAEDAGENLATWLTDNHDRYDSITILAHSLGSRVVLTALNELDDVVVDSVGLMGGAVNPDSVCGEFEAGIEQNADAVYNYHSENDNIVCYIYGAREFTFALGCESSDCGDTLPDKFYDVDVSEDVHGHCNYFKPDSLEPGNAIEQIVERQIEDDGPDEGDVEDDNGSEDDDDGGCFITTATAREDKTLDSLRRFRDESMSKTSLGRGMVGLYYRISPPIAETLDRYPESRTASLTRSIVQTCAGLSNEQAETDSTLKSIGLGIVLTVLYVVGILTAAAGHAGITLRELFNRNEQ